MSNKPSITVLYFAAASTTVGLTSEVVTIPQSGLPLTSLGDLLISLHPNTQLKEVLECSQWSVDAEMVDDPEKLVLRGGEEVAVICPVSGG